MTKCINSQSRNAMARSLAVLAVVLGALALVGSAQASEFGVEAGSFTSGLSTNQAGAHADFRTTFRMHVDGENQPLDGTMKDLRVELPPGLVGAANATPTCAINRMAEFNNPCPLDTAVGKVTVLVGGPGQPFSFPLTTLVYNLTPLPGEPAAFGFNALVLVRLDTSVRSDGDYGITATAADLTEATYALGADMTLWGVPADHNGPGPEFDNLGRSFGGPGASPRKVFMTNPTECSPNPLRSALAVSSWQHPTEFVGASASPGTITGCDELTFGPKLDLRPESRAAATPAGYAVNLEVPQNEDPDGLATPDVKDVTVRLPVGVTLSSSAANGLGACTDQQVGLGSTGDPACPDSSRIGTVSIATPLLDEPLEGNVYLGTQLSADPRSGQMVRLFLVAQGSGVTIKLPGSVVVDPDTGQLTATFADNPRLPFSDLRLALNGGPRAPLTTPSRCGTYTTEAEISSWAGGSPALSRSSFTVDQNCGAGSRFTPSLEAGTTNPVGGAGSPFTLTVRREDGQQNLSSIGVTLPEGLLAKLAGVPLCGDAEAAAGSCGGGSRIGSATVAAGDGSSPLWLPQAGKAPTGVFLAGPYKGAPYSIVTKVPAQAGPFDLGTVVVRTALRVDPETTQVTAASDPLPQIVSGVPVSYRAVNLSIDRPDFTVNPTNCEPSQVAGTVTSAGGTKATPSDRFQVADCGALAFGPRLSLQLKGAVGRRGHPALTATLIQPAGENANVATTTVILPKSEFIDQGHVKDPCTRVQFNEGRCPAASILGTATAYTPLLDKPLTGPVYFRSNGGERQLPDLVADLNGQIHVTLVGFIDSKKVGKEGSRVRTRFASVPDAPVSRFVLSLKGGKRGLIQNSADLCKARPNAEVKMAGQNGKTHDFTQPLSVRCPKKSKGKSKR